MPPIEINADCVFDELPFLRRVDHPKSLKTPTAPTFLDAPKFAKILHKFDTFIFDCDGVLWLGSDRIEGSPAFIDLLLANGKQVLCMTNNATVSRATYGKKLAKLGYNLGAKDLVNPSAVIADLLHRKGLHKSGKRVFVIGEQGVRDELDELGVPHFGHDLNDAQKPTTNAFLLNLDLEEKAENVGANLIVPDAGPILAACSSASGREPLIVGKPNTPAFDYICRRWSIDPKRTLMVGDRTDTDIKFGREHGLSTLLVLSGCHQMEDVVENQMSGQNDKVPHFYATNLGSLVPSN
ncbi:Phosphoglycolate/pyridoxal phosphate phosphatase family protein [Aphelenchoides fujianensis]|nr:Phosphoglycolate/pyridoxal phosphate phosphatase family protein [Aphelenchoides fujianensis]